MRQLAELLTEMFATLNLPALLSHQVPLSSPALHQVDSLLLLIITPYSPSWT